MVLFILILLILHTSQLDGKYSKLYDTPKDIPTHVKPANRVYELLKQYSNGDKLYLSGQCRVNLYSKYIIPVTLKGYFKKLLNNIFYSIYGITNERFEVQEFNNIYEQIDKFNNKRYIVDVTLNAINNYYTARVILDIVIINGEIFVNFISLNNASNNNIIDRYDIVFHDQGILLNHNNFTENVRSLMDQEYKEKYRLISFNSKYLDSKNYEFENVMSLDSILKRYLPSTLSSDSHKNLTMKGLTGQLDQYLPTDLPVVESPQFCDKSINDCVFHRTATQTEYNQPYMGPGLFFNRSSIAK